VHDYSYDQSQEQRFWSSRNYVSSLSWDPSCRGNRWDCWSRSPPKSDLWGGCFSDDLKLPRICWPSTLIAKGPRRNNLVIWMIRNYYTESASCRFRVMGVHVYAQVISLRALTLCAFIHVCPMRPKTTGKNPSTSEIPRRAPVKASTPLTSPVTRTYPQANTLHWATTTAKDPTRRGEQQCESVHQRFS